MRKLSNSLAVFAALVCGISVALSAYARHAAIGQRKEWLTLAALFAFGHGLALIALAQRDSHFSLMVKCTLVLGMVLFSGSLVMAAFFETSTAFVPMGGMVLILGWLLLAVDFYRNR